jgi:hypothetical protein
MRKDPAQRWPTAAAMADALDAAVKALGRDAEERMGQGPFEGSGLPPEPPPLPKAKPAEPGTASLERIAVPPSRAPQLALAAVATVLLVAGAVWLASDPLESPPPPVAAAPVPVAVPAPAPAPAPVSAPAPASASAPAPASASAPEVIALPDPVVVAPPPRVRRAPPASTTTSTSTATATGGGAEAGVVERAPGEVAFDEGRRRFLANDVPGAIARFEEAARLMPRSADVQKQLGRAYMRAGDVERSIAAYRRYLSLAPEAGDRTVVERIIAQHGGG